MANNHRAAGREGHMTARSGRGSALPDYYRYYQHGSEAYELAPEEIPAPRRAPRRRALSEKEKGQRNKARREQFLERSQSVEVDDKANSERVSLFLVLPVLFIMLAGIFYVVTFATVQANAGELSEYRAALKALQNENISATADLYANLDLAEIEAVATTRLGMVKPEEYQKVYLELPRQSYYTLTHEDTAVKKESVSLVRLIELVK